MDIDKLNISKLGVKERKLLLLALDIPTDNLKCYYCGKPVDYKNCGIMPSLPNNLNKCEELARITCNSPLCISQYFLDYEAVGDGR